MLSGRITKIIVGLLGCVAVGCSAAKKKVTLPALELPWRIVSYQNIKRTRYPADKMGLWRYHIALAKKFHSLGDEKLGEATKLCCLLRDGKSTQDWTTLQDAVEKSRFRSAEPDKLQIKMVNHIWREMVYADCYFLLCAIITAELRQKYYTISSRKGKSILYPTIENALQELPKMSRLEKKRDQATKARRACLQMMIFAPHLKPPRWEAIYQDIRKNSLILDEK